MKQFFKFLQEAAGSQAVQQATRMGLQSDGHGGWYKDGEFVAKTVKSKLVFYNKRQSVGGKDPAQTSKEKNISTVYFSGGIDQLIYNNESFECLNINSK